MAEIIKKTKLEKPLGYMLGQTRRVFKNKLMARYRENNVELSLDLFIILFHINLNEPLTLQELAGHLQKDKSIVMRQINVLTEKGYITRSWDRKDKRKKNLEITQKGLQMLEVSKSMAKKVSEELLSGISDEEQQTFERVIQQILINGSSEGYTINDKLKQELKS